MKKLMFAFAAAFPLFALADTNTVSRAEFDAMKKEVMNLRDDLNFLRGRYEAHSMFHRALDKSLAEDRKKLTELESDILEHRLKSGISEVKSRMEAWRKERNVIIAEKLREARKLREAKEKSQAENAATTSTTNAPTLFRK